MTVTMIVKGYCSDATVLQEAIAAFNHAVSTSYFSNLTDYQSCLASNALQQQQTTGGTKRGAPSSIISSLQQAGPTQIKREDPHELTSQQTEATPPDEVSLDTLSALGVDWGSFDPAYILKNSKHPQLPERHYLRPRM